MESHETVSETWLAHVLSDLGDSSEDIATTLRNAKISGLQQSMSSCPVARFVADRITHDIPSEHARVAVTPDTIMITRKAHDDEEYGKVLISAELPDPVKEFIERFDSAAFPDLIDTSAA